ncbi:MAG: hypothetical protein ACI3XI_07520 [Eubacteriales bacterium]
MKVLIWIGCCTLNYFISTVIKAVLNRIPSSDEGSVLLIGFLNGIMIAASAGFCIWLAVKLCAKWDWHKLSKKAATVGLTVSEYGKKGVSAEFLSDLEHLCNTVPYEHVKSHLKACVKKGIITKEQSIILLKEYSTVK